jgi:hypothetical protein
MQDETTTSQEPSRVLQLKQMKSEETKEERYRMGFTESGNLPCFAKGTEVTPGAAALL